MNNGENLIKKLWNNITKIICWIKWMKKINKIMKTIWTKLKKIKITDNNK